MTFIPVLAVRICGDLNWLARRAGFRGDYVLLTRLTANRTEYTPEAWGGRTMPIAHQYIIDNWGDLEDKDLIDVEFILGEKTEPCESERTAA